MVAALLWLACMLTLGLASLAVAQKLGDLVDT
jgi:hypothetical protein